MTRDGVPLFVAIRDDEYLDRRGLEEVHEARRQIAELKRLHQEDPTEDLAGDVAEHAPSMWFRPRFESLKRQLRSGRLVAFGSWTKLRQSAVQSDAADWEYAHGLDPENRHVLFSDGQTFYDVRIADGRAGDEAQARKPAAGAVKLSSKTGPKPVVAYRVEREMREFAHLHGWPALMALKKIEMRVHFGAGETTCMAVRKRIVASPENSDQTPNTDN